MFCMAYGFEPYEDRDYGSPEIVELMQQKRFPELNRGTAAL